MLSLPALALAVSLAAPTAPTVSGGEVPIGWAGENLSLDALPEALPESAAKVAHAWAPWAEEVGYRMDFTEDARVMLLTFDNQRARKQSTKNLKLIEETIDLIDTMLPIPASRPVEAGAPKEEGTYEWGKIELESQTAVLIEIDEDDHYPSAVEFVAQQSEYLAAWQRSAKSMNGFVIEQPLTAAWQPKAGIKEDWEGNPTNEMVNRLAQVMTLRRFGRVPYWLSMGIAWYVEMEQMDGVFCFPYYSGFMSASNHDNWDKALRNKLKKREEPISISELTALRRGTFQWDAAHMSWGTVAFLVRHHPGALAEICDELHRNWDEQGRETQSDGTWSRIPDYEPSEADQLAIFEQHVPDFKAQLLRFFIEGSRYKAP